MDKKQRMVELVELLNQLWKNGAKGYKDDDDELTAESVTKQVGLRMFGDLAGITVGGSELAELLENIFLGEKWYGIEIPGGEQLNDVIDTLSGTINSISKIITDGIDLAEKGGDLGAYLKKNAPDYAGDIKDLAEKTALYVGGLPAENIEKYLKGTIRTAAPEVYTYLEDRFDTADKTGLKGLTGKQLQIRTADILKNRGLDTETAETIAGLYERGFKGAVPSATPSSVTVNGEDHALIAAEQQRYSGTWTAVVNRSLKELTEHERFKSAEPEQQEKMLKKLYDYAAEHGKYALFPETESEGMRTIDHSDGIADWIVWNTLSGGNVDSYQKLSEAGLSDDGFLQRKEALDVLEPEAGKENVSKYQKAKAISGAGLSAADLNVAMADLLTESQMNGWKIANKNGISSEYIDALEFASGAEGVKDPQGNTITGSKALEIMMEIDSYDLTNTEKGVLYQALGYDGENKWRSKYKGPDFEAYYYLNDSEREKYWDYCSGMTATKFTEYITDLSTFHNTEVNGKVTEAKKDKVMAYIDGLNLPVEQKNGLYLAAGYKETTLDKCPWYSRYASLLLPKP